MRTPIYVVRVSENGEQYEYEYASLEHAEAHCKEERIKGNLAAVYVDTEY